MAPFGQKRTLLANGSQRGTFFWCSDQGDTEAKAPTKYESRGKESEGAKECPCLLPREQRAPVRAWTGLESREQGKGKGVQRSLPCKSPRARERAVQGVEGGKPRSHECAAPSRLRREHRAGARLS